MSRRYTLLIIDEQGRPVRDSRFSKSAVWLTICVLLIMLTSAGVGTYQYWRLHRSVKGKAQLQSQLVEQRQIIENQNKQIRLFAENINELKSSLVSLNDFEQKVRIMANLEHKDDQADLFAIGGSMPDDLDAQLAPRDDHSGLIRQMHVQVAHIGQAAAIQKTSFDELVNSLDGKRNILSATPSLRPTKGWTSSSFGYRVSPFTGKRELHKGIDFANRLGTPIIAPADGVVTYAAKKWLIGNLVTIDHGYGIVTYYGHLDTIKMQKGEKVKRGDILALMGDTGRSTGPHLHYEIHLNGVPVDPMKYILD